MWQAGGARVWAIEGTGHYGAGLARYLSARGETVLEIAARPRAERRLHGKDDALDAARAARAALASETLALPRAGERREALRLLLVARRSAVDVRRRSARAAAQRDRHRSRPSPRGVARPACRAAAQALQPLSSLKLTEAGRARNDGSCSRTLARRIEAATAEAGELEAEILTHVHALAPTLLDEPGIGPIVAAQLLVTWSHKGRVRSEAAFARLAGVAPIPASCGQTTRHRLSRGGDRQLNRALHTVVLHRRQHDPTTQAYIDRRIAEGKSSRDATRLLKRYLARHLYRYANRALMTFPITGARGRLPGGMRRVILGTACEGT